MNIFSHIDVNDPIYKILLQAYMVSPTATATASDYHNVGSVLQEMTYMGEKESRDIWKELENVYHQSLDLPQYLSYAYYNCSDKREALEHAFGDVENEIDYLNAMASLHTLLIDLMATAEDMDLSAGQLKNHRRNIMYLTYVIMEQTYLRQHELTMLLNKAPVPEPSTEYLDSLGERILAFS